MMRCLTLANHMRGRGMAVRFVTKPYRGSSVSSVGNSFGHDIHLLPSDGRGDVPYTEWQDPEWERDAQQTLAALADQQQPADWLIVDNYALSIRWETRLRAAARRIMVIDDLANRDHDCDLLLDQNLHRDFVHRYDRLVAPSCQRLLGPRYALLRPEFRRARAHLRVRDGTVRRILIFFGGVDVSDETSKALRGVVFINRTDIEVDVILGGNSPNVDNVRAACAALPNARLHCEPHNIAQLMAAADLSIGAAGSTTWERCCVGLPTVVISLAPNQESIADGLSDNGLGVYLGRRQAVTSERIAEALRELLADKNRIYRLSKACTEWVDGEGTSRTVSALETPET